MINPNSETNTGLTIRAGERRKAERATEDQADPHAWMSRSIGGPSVDPGWDAFFQALHEQGVDNLSGAMPSALDRAGQSSVQSGPAGVVRPDNALQGLRQLTGHAGAGEITAGRGLDSLTPDDPTDPLGHSSRAAYEALIKRMGGKSPF